MWPDVSFTHVDSNNNRGTATYFPAECSYASFKGDSCDEKSKGQMQNNKIYNNVISTKKCVKITIEAQLPQCLQVDVFLT